MALLLVACAPSWAFWPGRGEAPDIWTAALLSMVEAEPYGTVIRLSPHMGGFDNRRTAGDSGVASWL